MPLSILKNLDIGDRHYVETPLEAYADLMRRLNPAQSRRSSCIKDMKFTCTFYTAVGTRAGDVRYLVCVERLE
jgi:hypothetical protein